MTKNKTVRDFYEQHKNDGKRFWLCPNIAVNTSVTPKKFEQGLEFDKPPKELMDKEIVKNVWLEENLYCIIWRNE